MIESATLALILCGCVSRARDLFSSPAIPFSLKRFNNLNPVFWLIPNRSQMLAIDSLLSRQAWMNANLSDISELTVHGTGASRKVPECDAANS